MRLSACIAVALLAGCSQSSEPPPQNALEVVPDNIAAAMDARLAAPPGPIKYQVEACKAAIAVMMGRDPKTMSGKIVEGDLAHVSYRRPDDGKHWQARCRADGPNQITWAAFDAFGDGKQGRWREEEKITFEVTGKKLNVTVNQFGEPETGSYPISELQR